MTTYYVTTTGADLGNVYAETWEFVEHTDAGEVWEFTTENSTAAENLLDTDSAVISYKEKAARPQKQFSAAFEAFMATEAEEAIISSTRAGWGGSGCSVELSQNGTFHVLWNNQIGNLYHSEGVIIGVPQLGDDEYNSDDEALSMFDEALDNLRERFEMIGEGE